MSYENWETLRNLIDENCGQWLKEKGHPKTLLFRGTSQVPVMWDFKSPRTDRRPRLISKRLHDFLNVELKKKFGWNVRSEGLFTTANYGKAKIWGDVGIVMPVGNFKYIWMLKDDTTQLYNLFDDDVLSIFDTISDDEKEKFHKMFNKYRTDNLKRYLADPGNAGECIIKCDKYLLIHPEWKETILGHYK